MSECTVSLTTTGFIYSSLSKDDYLKKMNIPVCVAEICMVSNIEDIKILIDSIKPCAQVIKIDEEKKRFFVGFLDNEEYYLVDYIQNSPSQFSIEFFNRWKQIHKMIFEFVIEIRSLDTIINKCSWKNFTSSLFNKPSLRGFWNNDKWEYLEFCKNNSLEIEKIIKEKVIAL